MNTAEASDAVDPKGPTLGILGGMGPAACAELFSRFTQYWPAVCDQDHPRVVLLSEPSIPDRSAALIDSRSQDPTCSIAAALYQLVRWRSDLIAVPCNTAFAFIDNIIDDFSVPIVHTVAVALEAARACAPAGCWLLATGGTVSSRVYQKQAVTANYGLKLPDSALQARVDAVTHMVKAGELEDAGALLRVIMTELSSSNDLPFLFGCTELPLAWRYANHAAVTIDSVDTLAVECVRRLIPLRPLAGSGHQYSSARARSSRSC